jgi:predicted exporter
LPTAKPTPSGSDTALTGGGRPGRFAPLWLVVLALAVVLGVSAIGAARLQVVEDITALLPAGEAGDRSVVELARQAGLMRRVAIVIGPAEPGSERLLDAADAVAESVALVDGVREVVGRLDPEGARKAAEILMMRSMRLYRPTARPLDRDEVQRRLTGLKERLASPESLVLQRYLLADPLGFARDALRGIEGAAQGIGAAVDRGQLVSADGRYALVFAEIGFDPFEVERSTAFVDELDRAARQALVGAGLGDVELVALGGVHFAAASSGAIIRDVRVTFLITAAGVLLVFVVFLRRFRLLPAVLLPGGVGIAVASGVMGFADVELHALTVGFAAAITGISVDYAIHLLYRSLHAVGVDTGERMAIARRAVARPVILGCSTTVIAFVIIAGTGFPGVRQLALFSAISVPVALLVTLVGLPVLHRALLGGPVPAAGIGGRLASGMSSIGSRGASRARRVVVISLFALLAIGAAVSGAGAPRSGDPRDLGSRDRQIAEREARLTGLFPGLTSQALIAAGGDDLEQALRVNDTLYAALLDRGLDRRGVLSVSPFLPSREAQDRSLAAARELLFDNARNTAGVFTEAGFTASYHEGLRAGLEAPAIGPADFDGTSLERFVAEAIPERAEQPLVITRVSVGADADLDQLQQVVAAIPGCTLVSERLQARTALLTMQRELVLMLGIWLVVALLLISAVQRSPVFGLRSALPAIVGVAAAAGLFGLLDRPLTPVAAAGLTLVMGLGIDYGIFMQGRTETIREAAPAVLASALTTLAAFGALSFAATRAMADLGLIILVGVGVAALTALVLLPALQAGRSRGEGTS